LENVPQSDRDSFLFWISENDGYEGNSSTDVIFALDSLVLQSSCNFDTLQEAKDKDQRWSSMISKRIQTFHLWTEKEEGKVIKNEKEYQNKEEKEIEKEKKESTEKGRFSHLKEGMLEKIHEHKRDKQEKKEKVVEHEHEHEKQTTFTFSSLFSPSPSSSSNPTPQFFFTGKRQNFVANLRRDYMGSKEEEIHIAPLSSEKVFPFNLSTR